jgi:hypothetical protein
MEEWQNHSHVQMNILDGMIERDPYMNSGEANPQKNEKGTATL